MKEQLQLANKTEYISWLLYLPRGIDRLKQLGKLRKYPADYLLAEAGSHTKYCYVVISGRVVSSEYSESGEERIYSVNEKDSLLLKNPETAMDVLQSLSMKLLSSMEQMKCMNEHSAMQKVCSLLLSFAERYGEKENDSIVIREKISQEYISSLLGMNRITVVRVMKELKEKGLVDKKRGYYYLHDINQMQENQSEKWA